MAPTPESHGIDPPAPSSRLPAPSLTFIDRILIGASVLIMLACGAALWQRDALRAHWWARRLSTAQGFDEQRHYVTLLASLGESAVTPVARLMEQEDPRTRILAAGILAHTACMPARNSLVKALHDPDVEVREAAALALAFGHETQVVPALAAVSREADAQAAAAACVALGMIASNIALPALLEAAEQHPEAAVRAQAVEMLGMRRAPEAEKVLKERLTDQGRFSVMLYGERRLSGAIAFADSQQGTQTPALSRPADRTVASVADDALKQLVPVDASQDPISRSDPRPGTPPATQGMPPPRQ